MKNDPVPKICMRNALKIEFVMDEIMFLCAKVDFENDPAVNILVPFFGISGEIVFLREQYIKDTIHDVLIKHVPDLYHKFVQHSTRLPIGWDSKIELETIVIRETHYGAVDYVIRVTGLPDFMFGSDGIFPRPDKKFFTETQKVDDQWYTQMISQVEPPVQDRFASDDHKRLSEGECDYTLLYEPQYSSREQNKFYHLLRSELMESFSTDSHLTHTDILIYQPIWTSCKHPARFCFGTGMSIYFKKMTRVLNGLLVILFVTFIFVTFKYRVDVNEVVSVTHFVPLRQRSETKFREKLISFFIILIATIRLMNGCVELSLSMRMIYMMVKSVMKLVVAFLAILIMISVIFAVAGWLLFSSNDAKFRDIIVSLQTLIFASVNDLEVEAGSKDPVTLLYYILWFFVMPLVLLNVIVAILMTSWDTVKAEMDATEYQAERPNPCKIVLQVVLERFGGCCCKYEPKTTQEDETNIRKGALLASLDQWPSIYPEGCPPRLMKQYIQNYWHIDADMLDKVMDLVADKDKGLVSWKEITSNMLEVMPSLEGKIFELNASIDEQLNRMDLELVKRGHIEELARDLELVKKDQLIKELQETVEKQTFRMERMEKLLDAIALSLKVDPDLPAGGFERADMSASPI